MKMIERVDVCDMVRIPLEAMRRIDTIIVPREARLNAQAHTFQKSRPGLGYVMSPG
jgi:hypothetical protein